MRENFQGPPIAPLSVLFGEDLDVVPSSSHALECYTNSLISHEDVEQGRHPISYLKNEILEEDYTHSHLDDTMPFLQMLQESFELPHSHFSAAQQPSVVPSFQMLLNLQHQKLHWQHNHLPVMQNPIPISCNAMEPESCLSQSPASFETPSSVSPYCHLEPTLPFSQLLRQKPRGKPRAKETQLAAESADVRPEKRKRKRATTRRDKEEVESQRITHIAVERTRRRLMNDHLHSLRSLMPPSYAQRGDQASIIGGAIDFVKELEQLLQSLHAQKRMRTTTSSNSQSPPPPPREKMDHQDEVCCKREAAEVKVVAMMQKHVNLKVEYCGGRKEGQLVRAIVALEELRLTVLHLNITTTTTTTSPAATVHHYSFSLKMEDDCRLQTPDEIVGAVHQIFS